MRPLYKYLLLVFGFTFVLCNNPHDKNTYDSTARLVDKSMTGNRFTSFNLKETVKDIDGNVYHTILIGKQIWMKENLKVTHYNNGDLIPLEKDTSILTRVRYKDGRYWDLENDTNISNEYGKLYNWYVANDSRNVCPIGWHVPTSSDWWTLIDYLGGESSAGYKLKESGISHWVSPNFANNESKFTALPGSSLSYVDALGHLATFWPADTNKCFGGDNTHSSAPSFALQNNDSTILRVMDTRCEAHSIRCLKDSTNNKNNER